MSHLHWNTVCSTCLLTLAALVAVSGCHAVPGYYASQSPVSCPPAPLPIDNAMPRELDKVVLPPYAIEPPDILMIDAVHVVPRAPYRLRVLDVLAVQVPRDAEGREIGTLPNAPLAGSYAVEPGGLITLGTPYGSVQVAGLR